MNHYLALTPAGRLLLREVPDKATVAALLATIADGRPPFACCEDDPGRRPGGGWILSESGRSLDAEMAEGRRYAEEIRQQIVRRLDLLVPYVREPDVHVFGILALGNFPEAADRFLPYLQEVLREEPGGHAREVLQEVVDRLTRHGT